MGMATSLVTCAIEISITLVQLTLADRHSEFLTPEHLKLSSR